MSDLPYQAEYAKSGRAKCKLCKQTIDQGTLRLAVMVQSAFFDGKEAHWHHEPCFFKKARVFSVTEIANFTKLKSGDKKSIKATVESNVPGVVVKGKGKKRSADTAVIAAVKDFAVEYAKSNRATCKHCDIKICKGDVRICKTVFDTDVGKKYGGQPLWHHPNCFAAVRSTEYLLFEPSGEYLPGFNTLTKDDQNMVKELIKPLKADDIPIKKIKSEPKSEKEEKDEKKQQAAKEKLIEKQNKLYHKYRNALSQYKKADLHELLEYNSQEIFSSADQCLDLLAECMAFGALEPCPECKNGQLVLDNFGYKCTGNISDWSKCLYTTRDPKKRPMQVPESFKQSSAFHKYKAKVAVREFEMAPPPPAIVIKHEDTNIIKKDIPMPPLKNLQFFLLYKGTKDNKEAMKHRILRMGGLVVSHPNDTTAAVISNVNEIEKMSSKMQDVQELDIEVVDEKFLDSIPKDGTVLNTLDLIKKHNIADWGSDPMKRVPQDVIDGKFIVKSGSQYQKSKSAVTKLKIKGGTAVDPDSGLEDTAHVYKDEDGTKYTVTLSKTDVVAQKNSYYKIQLLEHDNKKKFWLFRAWGRIGTTVGGNKLEEIKSLHQAISKFEDVYMERTMNPWECRDYFMKMPDCYHPIDLDYGDENVKPELKVDTNCKLALPVQQLIMKIFDIDVMKKTLLEFELDTEKMPLGKLSRKQITSGYKVLSELLKHIEKGQVSETKMVDATNRFFTLIPHDFGSNNAPLLNSVDIIQNKTQMLDNLLEIEIAYSLLKSDSNDNSSPIESHYMKLKTDIAPLPRDSDDFKLIAQYTSNTHAVTHSNYTLEIQQVFKVVREGESKRYKPFKKLHNRKLLWHGSRITNFAGILSQGLRIAPPEAPVTGYMFGKGIYFADMVSKSANYCCTNKSNPVGLLMLCEVALGDMKECTRAENITKLPAGKHSAWGVGRTCPDPEMIHTLEDGIVVPYGKPVTKKDLNTSLLYNEFIVYDVAQVNVKYLLQVKFNYK